MKKHQDKGIASKGYISEEATETGAKRNKQSKIGIALFAVCCILILLLTGLALYLGVGVRDGENGLNGKFLQLRLEGFYPNVWIRCISNWSFSSVLMPMPFRVSVFVGCF